MLNYFTVTVPLLALALPAAVAASPVVFAVGGSTDASSIQATVDGFRAALGNPNNGNTPGPLASGRREINWDGGGATVNAPGGTPFNVFLNIRGGQFVTPGAGFVQAPASATAPNVDDVGTFFGNATYDTTFGVFSQQRLFVPVDSNVTNGLFFIPGTAGSVPAEVRGFGAVFTDVDLLGSTTLEYFDIAGNLLFEGAVPIGTVANQSLSFLGVVFNAGERISRVRIITGNTPLGANNNDDPGNGVDLVALDDFLYSEPLEAVPEPATLTLFGTVAIAFMAAPGGWRARRKRASL